MSVGPWIVGVAGVVTAVAVLAAAAKRTFSLLRRIGHFLDDWAGEPERPGVEARPGVLERLENIEDRLGAVEHEVRHNSDGSLKDAVRRIERIEQRLEELRLK